MVEKQAIRAQRYCEHGPVKAAWLLPFVSYFVQLFLSPTVFRSFSLFLPLSFYPFFPSLSRKLVSFSFEIQARGSTYLRALRSTCFLGLVWRTGLRFSHFVGSIRPHTLHYFLYTTSPSLSEYLNTIMTIYVYIYI